MIVHRVFELFLVLRAGWSKTPWPHAARNEIGGHWRGSSFMNIMQAGPRQPKLSLLGICNVSGSHMTEL